MPMDRYNNQSCFTNRFHTILLLIVCLLSSTLSGCSMQSEDSSQNDFRFSEGNMLHFKQILEHYDVNGDPVPQYFEFWLTKDLGKCIELDEEGNYIRVTLDDGKRHIQYDPLTLEAVKAPRSFLFVINYASMVELYPEETYYEQGEYLDRSCFFYLNENTAEEQWIKMYVDESTGYTLFSENENFRLRTALFEEIPLDEDLFRSPDGLDFKGGN